MIKRQPCYTSPYDTCPNRCWRPREPLNARNSGYRATTELRPELEKTGRRALQAEMGPRARFQHFWHFLRTGVFSLQKVRFPSKIQLSNRSGYQIEVAIK